MLEEKTNINNIYHTIKEKIIRNYKCFLSEDMKQRYIKIMNDLNKSNFHT